MVDKKQIRQNNSLRYVPKIKLHHDVLHNNEKLALEGQIERFVTIKISPFELHSRYTPIFTAHGVNVVVILINFANDTEIPDSPDKRMRAGNNELFPNRDAPFAK